MAKRYMVFAYFNYEALGGIHDCKLMTDNQVAAQEKMNELIESKVDTVEIFDIKDEKIIKTYKKEID